MVTAGVNVSTTYLSRIWSFLLNRRSVPWDGCFDRQLCDSVSILKPKLRKPNRALFNLHSLGNYVSIALWYLFIRLNFYSTKMKISSLAIRPLLAAGFIQTVVGLDCGSGCAACWKTDSPGVDINLLAMMRPAIVDHNVQRAMVGFTVPRVRDACK
jgi:hypothetical protein